MLGLALGFIGLVGGALSFKEAKDAQDDAEEAARKALESEAMGKRNAKREYDTMRVSGGSGPKTNSTPSASVTQPRANRKEALEQDNPFLSYQKQPYEGRFDATRPDGGKLLGDSPTAEEPGLYQSYFPSRNLGRFNGFN